MAGIAAGRSYECKPIADAYPGGVAPKATVTMFCVKPNSYRSILKAFEKINDYADTPFDVVSISLGGHEKVNNVMEEKFRKVIREIKDKGTMIFAAAGNIGELGPICFPARLDGVIKVGATDRLGYILPTSRSGLDIYCCGEVRAPTNDGRYSLTTERGSSNATAAAAGLACLLIQAAKDKEYDYKEFRHTDRIKTLFEKMRKITSDNSILYEPETFFRVVDSKGKGHFNDVLNIKTDD